MKQRSLSLFLALILILSIAPISIFQVSAAARTIDISVESVYAKPGSEVTVLIKAENNPGVAGAKISIEYSPSLTLTGAKAGDAFADLYYTGPGRYTSPCNFIWDSENSESNEDGVILTLTFTVSANAALSSVLPVTVSCRNGDVYDKDLNTVTAILNNGGVTVLGFIPGDLNDDGSINGKDVTLLRRYIAGGYDVSIIEDAADVNDDGAINGKDITILRRYIAGGYGVSLLPPSPKCDHAFETIAPKDATCTENGNIAYWRCTKCGKLFSDAYGNVEIEANSVIIPATGHTIVIDEAVPPSYEECGKTEGQHCSVCGAILMEQVDIAKLEPLYHAITYKNIKTAESPEITRFAEHTGLLNLPELSVAGYKFTGWYTASTGGDLIDYIPAGETKDYVLFAHWELETYNITYNDAPVNNNPAVYTVEDEIILSDPIWSGLSFNNWTDEEGNVITRIDKGNVGNITLTANWISEENMAIPAKGNKNKAIIFDEALGRYYFVYELGTIENIVLASLGTDDKSVGEQLKWSISETVSVEDGIADTVARTVSSSISKTNGWSEARNWATSASVTETSSITAGLEVEEFGVKAKIEAEIGVSSSISETESYGYGTSGSTTSGNSSSDSVSSTVSYKKGVSKTISKEITIPVSMPKGKYSYVYAGTAHVYAVVTYDIIGQNYYLDTYSVLDDMMYEKRLYQAPVDSTANISFSDGLDFDIPVDEICDFVNKDYYVRFESDGASGTMPIQIMGYNESVKLKNNSFVKNGYTFCGWKYDNGTEVLTLGDGEIVKDLVEGGEVVVLTALWKVDPYTIGRYVPNGSTVSDSSGENTYTVFNVIGETPQISLAYCPGGKAIIDWSKYTGRYNYISEVTATGSRYGGGNTNLDFAAPINEVFFIGNTNATFTNVHLVHANYTASNATPTVHIKDINLEDSSVWVYTDGEISNPNKDMILDIDGNCLIKAINGSDAIFGFNNLTITGSGSLTVYGGNGNEGATTGNNGTNGRAGISATNVIIGISGVFDVYGGNGMQPGTPSQVSGRTVTGTNGYKGGDGGTAIKASSIDVFSGNVHLHGGNGGTGGTGGTGSKGISEWETGSNGGTGGKGGTGGTGGVPTEGTITVKNSSILIYLYGGNGGKGGTGGTGGAGGISDGGGVLILDNSKHKGLNGGTGGKGGTGGVSSLKLIQNNYTESYYVFVNESELKPGLGGNAGSGGARGYIYNHSWDHGTYYGSAGSSGASGSQGDY